MLLGADIDHVVHRVHNHPGQASANVDDDNDGIPSIEEAGFKVDYVEIADSSTLTSIKDWVESKKVVALIAAYNNEIRLIDNMLLFN